MTDRFAEPGSASSLLREPQEDVPRTVTVTANGGVIRSTTLNKVKNKTLKAIKTRTLQLENPTPLDTVPEGQSSTSTDTTTNVDNASATPTTGQASTEPMTTEPKRSDEPPSTNEVGITNTARSSHHETDDGDHVKADDHAKIDCHGKDHDQVNSDDQVKDDDVGKDIDQGTEQATDDSMNGWGSDSSVRTKPYFSGEEFHSTREEATTPSGESRIPFSSISSDSGNGLGPASEVSSAATTATIRTDRTEDCMRPADYPEEMPRLYVGSQEDPRPTIHDEIIRYTNSIMKNAFDGLESVGYTHITVVQPFDHTGKCLFKMKAKGHWMVIEAKTSIQTTDRAIDPRDEHRFVPPEWMQEFFKKENRTTIPFCDVPQVELTAAFMLNRNSGRIVAPIPREPIENPNEPGTRSSGDSGTGDSSSPTPESTYGCAQPTMNTECRETTTMEVDQGDHNATASGSDVEMNPSQEEPARSAVSMSPDWGDRGFLSELD